MKFVTVVIFPYEIYFRFITPYSSTLFVVCSFSLLFHLRLGTSNPAKVSVVAATVFVVSVVDVPLIEIIDKNRKARG